MSLEWKARTGRAAGALVLAGGMAALAAGSALAATPEPWQVWHQPSASPVMDAVVKLNTEITWIMIAVVVFVMLLLGYVILRFNAKANPTPRQFHHNVMLEVAWTLLPVIILVVIAVPSFNLLYYMDRTAESEMTLKVVGHQWFWSYEYPDQKEIAFDAFMVQEDALEEGQTRLLSTDAPVVLPVDTNIRILITADDVIHSWAMPAMGIKTDAVPGRLNETWVRIEEEGTYYGQCSELCGVYHGFMPIEIRAISRADFDAWVTATAEDYGNPDAPATQLAGHDPLPIPASAQMVVPEPVTATQADPRAEDKTAASGPQDGTSDQRQDILAQN